MNKYGWATYGWTEWGNPDWNGGPEQTEARVYKHFRGMAIAVPTSVEDPYLLLAQLNEYLGGNVNAPEQPIGQEPTFTITVQELIAAIIEQTADQHRHQWAVIGVNYPNKTTTGRPIHPRLPDPDQDVTFVLAKCHCGEVKSEAIVGRWSMNDLMIEVAHASQARSTTASHPESDSQPSGEYPPS